MSDHPRTTLSASSSMSQQPASKADQVVHRVYLKTVGVLVDSRLTHYGQGQGGKSGQKKKDKWFNVIMPDIELHRQDLRIYQSVSTYPLHSAGPSSNASTIPPLLIAFILDTSDLPSGQALLWNRAGAKVTLDAAMMGKGKGKEKEARSGIVLERWTFRASCPPSAHPSYSQHGAPQAYQLGIIHFRALFSLVRLLPAYRLFRRLRRGNTGLKLGLKLWSPEGYGNDDSAIRDAWGVMERDLIGLETGLESLAHIQTDVEEDRRSYVFPTLDMFGLEYTLDVQYRSEVDFLAEDLESVLSEKFVDMEEDWFKPTVARHRSDTGEGSATESTGSSAPQGMQLDMSGLQKPERRTSGPAPISSHPSNASPIPLRQGPASIGSFRGSIGRPSSSRVPSALGASKEGTTPGSLGRWGTLAEGLPFAPPRSPGHIGQSRAIEPPSPSTANPPSGAMITARRLSGHSAHPGISPSTSLARVSSSPFTSDPRRPSLGVSKPSSIGRTSSFLSQSGRSFTHAQLATMGRREPVAIGSTGSPPIPGTSSNMSPDMTSSGSPSSLSFTKQPLHPRIISDRPPFASSSSRPFVPGSFDKEATSLTAGPQSVKRLSSYSARRDRLAASPASAESPALGGEMPGSLGMGTPRRSSMRMSYEAGLRRSLDRSGSASGSGSGSGSGAARVLVEDHEDIEAFLKTLDALPQPPMIAAQAIHASRSHLPSTSSSLSVPSIPASPSPQPGSQSGGSPNAAPAPTRAPLTKAAIDAQLRRMVGSFQQSMPATVDVYASSSRYASRPSAVPVSSAQSIGLLSASRPMSAPRRVSQTESRETPSYRRSGPSQQAGSGPGSVKIGSPLSQEAHRSPAIPAPAPSQQQTIAKKPSARSLPGPATTALQDEPDVLRSAGVPIPPYPLAMLSPQTTGGGGQDTGSTRSRRSRGPVLLRGGFGDNKSDRDRSYAKSSVSSSPSHSPVRDFGARMHMAQRDKERSFGAAAASVMSGMSVGYGERQAEEELDSWNRVTSAAAAQPLHAGPFTRHKSVGQSAVNAPGVTPQQARLGLGTAPSSYMEPGEVHKDPRGRQGRVKSEGQGDV